ncbi:hypothetical protein [Marinoscillum luteum]|uniref:Uncharacterized protein n=1 Tax=Marinoscillum luteum TaxID=861051 RepID=A0ABW7N474_9BACT
MKRISIGILFLIVSYLAVAQENEQTSLGATIDKLSYDWDLEADNLNSYDGLSKFCLDKDYRIGVIQLLNDIHHYDSVLYDRLTKASRFNKDKEIDKTLKEISKFETGYSLKDFIHFLHEECTTRSDIEKHSTESRNDIGSNSYDGQVYIVETELNKFIKHITKRVDHIREHVHHLHIK